MQIALKLSKLPERNAPEAVQGPKARPPASVTDPTVLLSTYSSPSPFDFVWELSVRILCPFRGCTLHVLNWLFCVVYHLQCNASSLIDLFRPKTDSERTLFRPTYPLAPILATLCNANAEYTPPGHRLF